MPKLLDYQAFCEDLKEVTSIKIMDKRKFNPNGLFSEQIFGPVKNYTCQCGIYHGPFKDGNVCEDCGVDIVNSSERRRRFAKIYLPLPVVNPVFYDLLVNLGGNQLKSALEDLMKNEEAILYLHPEEEDLRIGFHGNIPDGAEQWTKVEAIEKLVHTVTDFYVNDGYHDWQIVKDNLDKLIIDQIIVLPPDLRPATARGNKNDQVVDEINRYYVQILTKKDIMKDTIIDIRRDNSLFYNYFKQLQKDVNELYTHILDKLSKKEGLIRGNILGKRIDFSGRAVIVPDPTLTFGDCSLPYLMILELYKLQISKKLVEMLKFKLLNEAIDFVDDCISYKNPILFKICEEITKDEVCILNRQPSLHRLSMLGFRIKMSLDSIIKIHPLACPPFNADFDGDQMAVYIPISEETKQEVIDKLLINKNLTDPANGNLTTTPSQDIILGIYALTGNQFQNLKEEYTYKGSIVSEGIKIFNEVLPEDYPLIVGQVDEKVLIAMLNDIKKKYPMEVACEVLDDIKRIGFKYSTLLGSTLSLSKCRIPEADEIRDEIYKVKNVREQLMRVSGKETQDLLKKNFHYAFMIDSGARGKWDQARQIVLTRGFISNFKGHILPTPIKNSLLKGLNPQEFFNSTYGCRKGLLDVALNTGSSGYLSRKLIFTGANLQIGTEDDCGTEDTLKVHVTSEKKARMLIGKYEVKGGTLQLIDQSNYKAVIDKVIQVRSPILCKTPHICHACYGELRTILDSRFIGVIAAQSLGECNTQLVLRTFHTSGVAVIKDEEGDSENMEQQDIVNELSRASKLLHQFNKKTNYVDLCHNLYDVYNSSRSINHVHFECIVAQLMWKDFRKWRLYDNREKIAPEYHSVQTVPSYESWLLSLAFSNPKKSILRGILYSGNYSGVMDKILKGEKIS